MEEARKKQAENVHSLVERVGLSQFQYQSMKESTERQFKLEKQIQELQVINQQLQPTRAEKQVYALLTAVQTMRKTGCFGDTRHPIGFEWPLATDLLRMPKDVSIEI